VDDLGQIVVKALAVAGGAAVGALLTGAIVGLIIRQLFRKPQPPAVRTLVRILGGVAGGLAVAVLLFSGMGGGGWGIGSWGLGTGKGTGDSASARTAATQPDKPSPPEPPPKSLPTTPESTRVRVIMLGGDLVRNGAAYRVEGERQARTLADVQQVIRRRMAADPPAKALDILIYENSVARGTAPVDDLELWARQNGLTVNVVTAPGDIPP
ncbi:MAG TPA: hypothetical protein VGF55_23230, partial [Gemmataceae bacterium]|jgi:hypothetical protein